MMYKAEVLLKNFLLTSTNPFINPYKQIVSGFVFVTHQPATNVHCVQRCTDQREGNAVLCGCTCCTKFGLFYFMTDGVVVTATVICHGSEFTHFGLLQTLVISHQCVVHHMAKLWWSNRTTAFGILPSRLYFSVVVLCTVFKPTNNQKCDPSVLNDMISWEESGCKDLNVPAIYSCRLEWVMKAHWEQEIYPKEEC